MSGPDPTPPPVSPVRPAASDLDSLLSLRTPEVEPSGSVRSETGGADPDSVGHDPQSGSGELRDVHIDAIVPNEYQPRRRFEEEALRGLTESIRELGVLQPVLVRPLGSGKYELVAGERRWRAARRAGLRAVPAIVRTTGDIGSLEQAIVENLHRADLTAIEEAAAYQQLVEDFGFTQAQVATRVGRSRSAVSNTLRLLQLPMVIQRMINGGELSAGHARAILALSDRADQITLAERIVLEEMSVRAAEEAAKAVVSDADSGPGDRRRARPEDDESSEASKSAAALEVQRRLEERLATRVEVVESSGNGRIMIRFADHEDLDRIYRILGE